MSFPLGIASDFLLLFIVGQGIVAVLIRVVVIVLRQLSGILRFDLALATYRQFIIGDFFPIVRFNRAC